MAKINKMFRLAFHYYKDLLLINSTFSFLLGIIAIPFGCFFQIFILSFMTGGYWLSILFFEGTKQDQYYFYFNMGLSKMRLYGFSLFLNLFFGLNLILFVELWKVILK